jgi:hypothetical protein
MTDITMCDRQDCPSRHQCYRFTAMPNVYRQAYFAPEFSPVVNGKCEYFTQDRRFLPDEPTPGPGKEER